MRRGPSVASASRTCTAARAITFVGRLKVIEFDVAGLTTSIVLAAVTAAREKGSESLGAGMASALTQLPPHHSVQLVRGSMLVPSRVGKHLGCQEAEQQPARLPHLRAPRTLFVSRDVEM